MKKTIFSQYGRSMVEMLGVLAIIGVLSVGSIAGYSKAMTKYKLNKFTTSMNELINTSIILSRQIQVTPNLLNGGEVYFFANILYKMNSLPDGIKYKDNQYLEDMFGNSVWAYSYTGRTSELGYSLGLKGSNKLNNEICHQLVNIAKENSSQLGYINTDSYGNGEDRVIFGRYYGDSYCSTADRKCLKNIKLSDIDTLCHSCQQNRGCRFYFSWYR